MEDSALARAEERIRPWETLSEGEILIEAERLGPLELARIGKTIQERGIALLRMDGSAPELGLLAALARSFGPVSDEQNAFRGAIKEIRPSRGVEANSGDSSLELGAHVDGTQHAATPALLGFQYVHGAAYGAHSQFWDAAGALASLPAHERHRLLALLARPDAARFLKNGIGFSGPIAWLPRRGSAALDKEGMRDEALRTEWDAHVGRRARRAPGGQPHAAADRSGDSRRNVVGIGGAH